MQIIIQSDAATKILAKRMSTIVLVRLGNARKYDNLVVD